MNNQTEPAWEFRSTGRGEDIHWERRSTTGGAWERHPTAEPIKRYLDENWSAVLGDVERSVLAAGLSNALWGNP